MSREHTLPGDLPGLLRRGSPVVVTREIPWWSPSGERLDHEPGDIGLVYAPDADGAGTALTSMCDDPDIPTASIALDLTDPTGRIHALWWLLRLDDADTDPIIAFETSGKRWEHIVGAVVTATDDLTPDDLGTFTRVLRAAAEVVRG